MTNRRALVAVALALLVLGSGIAGAAAVGAASLQVEQPHASTDGALHQSDSGRVTNGTGDTTGTDGTADSPAANTTTKSGSAVSSRLRQRLDSGAGGGGDGDGPADDGEAITVDGAPDRIEVVVEATPGNGDRAVAVVTGAGGDVTARHEGLVQARVPAMAVEAVAGSPAVGFVRLPIRPSVDAVTSEGVETMNATWAHDRNITGENVTVAVVDVGFDLTNPEIADNVVDYGRFPDGDFVNESGAHGTAVTELVVDTAPNADIVAIRVDSYVGWLQAVEYVQANTTADVVTQSLSWYGVGPLDGTSEMNQEITTLRDNGTLWVNSAGNNGNGDHWNGTWVDADGDDLLEFDGTDERLTLSGNGTVRVYMNWDDWTSADDDYDLYLYDGDGTEVANSTNTQDGTTSGPFESIVLSGTSGPLYLEVHRYNASGAADFDLWFTGDYTPEYWTAQRSVPNPGVGDDVLTTGAVYFDTREIEAFSSRGPTIDGRMKPDLVAPDGVTTSTYDSAFYGTSAAAPHAAGVAALLAQVNRSITPTGIETTLYDTTVHVNGTEPDNTYGNGLVDATAAIRSQSPVANVTPTHLSYGTVHLTSTASRNVTVTNEGDLALNITAVEIAGTDASAFTVTTGGEQGTLSPGASRDVAIEFNSSTRGTQNATLSVSHNGTDSPTTVSLTGETVAPDVSVSPADDLDFGNVSLRNETATEPVTVENNGSAPLNLTGATISGQNESAFALDTGASPPPVVIDPGATVTYNVTVTVNSIGTRTAVLEFTHNVSDRDAVNVSMTATGADQYPPIVSNAMATDVDGDTVLNRTGSVTIAVESTDESGVENVTVNATALGNGTVTLGPDGGDWYNGTVSVDSENATEGTLTLPIVANDTYGQANYTETNEITVDLTNVSLTVEQPSENAGTNETAVNVTGTAQDTLSGVGSVSVRVDGGTWVPATFDNTNWYQNVTNLSEGTHEISVQATDRAGNVGPITSRSIVVDTTPPVIESVTLAKTAGLLPEADVAVNVTASDKNLSVTSVTVDGTALVNDSGVWTGTIQARSSLGSHDVPVQVTDGAGNANETSITYSVGRNATLSFISESRYRAATDDPGIANVTIESPVDVSGQNVTVGTASSNPTTLPPPNDTALAFPQVETTVSNANISNATVEVHIEKSTTEDRSVLPETIAFWVHNGTAWNRSTAPRVGETSSTLVYDLQTTHFSTFAATANQDTMPPSITDLTPASGATITNTQPEISAAYEDDLAGIDTDSVTLSIDGTAVTSEATVTSSSVSYTPPDPLDSGSHSVTVSVADAVGNTNERTWSFTIEAETTESPTDDGGGGGGGGGGGSQVVEEPPEEDTGTSITGTRAEVDVTDGTAIETVIFHSSVEMNATVTVTELSTSPHPEPAGTTFVTAIDIVFETGTGEDVERIGFVVPRSTITETGVSPDTLRVYHYDADAGQWEGLETTVVEETVDRVVVESPAAGFSTYGIFDTRNATTTTVEETTSEMTTTETGTTPTESERTTTEAELTTEETTTTSQRTPGFGITVAVFALIGGALIALRRQRD